MIEYWETDLGQAIQLIPISPGDGFGDPVPHDHELTEVLISKLKASVFSSLNT